MKPARLTDPQRRLLGELARRGVYAVAINGFGAELRNEQGDWLGVAFGPSLNALHAAGFLDRTSFHDRRGFAVSHGINDAGLAEVARLRKEGG